MKKNIIFLFVLFGIIILWIFKSWFLFGSLSSGDWDYQYSANLRSFSLLPYSRDPLSQNGMGGNVIYLLPLLLYYHTTIYLFFHVLHLPWVLIERIAWYWPFLGLSFFSMFYLSRKIFSNTWVNCIAGFMYLSNTYILMIIGGGQMGYAMAYGLAPLVFGQFITVVDLFSDAENIKNKRSNIKNEIKKQKLLKESILSGLVLSLLLLFDIRVTYIVLIAVMVYLLFELVTIKFNLSLLIKIATSLIISSIVAIFLHAFWLLPLLITKQNPVQEVGIAYTSISSVKFFSFATFENALGLLHPNWPENIFGKVGFMKPEFLVLPVLAFSSLLFIKKSNSKNQISKISFDPESPNQTLKTEGQIKNQKINNSQTMKQPCLPAGRWNNGTILYFALLGLIGTFLAKGANEPFGNVYVWLFSHIPGFVMFRDPTKWYVLIVLSYSVLIPFSLEQIFERVFSIKTKTILYTIYYILYTVLWLFLIRQAVFGELNGTFKTHVIPQEYVQLENILSNDPHFYRTLWVPTQQRYGFSSSIHPAVSAVDFFQNSNPNVILKKLQNKDTINMLEDASIRYIIVPDDSEKEIYLKDHRYNRSLHALFIDGLNNNHLIIPSTTLGNIKIYSLPQSKDHFWLSSSQGTIFYQKVNPVTFSVSVSNVTQGEKVVFAENYDSYWKASNSNIMYSSLSIKYGNAFNSFELPKDGSYTFTIYYEPQKWVNVGFVVSGISVGIIIISLLWLSFAKNIV